MTTSLEIHEALRQPLKQTTAKFLAAPFLQACRNLSLPRAEFNKVAQARFSSGAALFEQLLEHALRVACAQDSDHPLIKPLLRNLSDERGMSLQTPALRSRGGHAAWRRNLRNALNLQAENDYEVYMNGLLESEDLALISGTLLWLEYAIPQEFEIILTYLENSRPEAFSDMPDHAEARLYLADHIRHDADYHFPDLLRGIAESDLEIQGLKAGISYTAEAKMAAFYMRTHECQ